MVANQMQKSFCDIKKHAMQGISLIEVLITVVILAIGLLGLAGLQVRLQTSEIESYQRTHALILLEDMANRISANRNNAAAYDTAGTPLGTGDAQPNACVGNGQAFDACQWSNALKGTSELSATANNVGAMIGARGCVEDLGGTGVQFLITVAWQGLTPISAPASACGTGLYNGATGSCVNDMCRRTMSTIVRIADLN